MTLTGLDPPLLVTDALLTEMFTSSPVMGRLRSQGVDRQDHRVQMAVALIASV